MWIYKVQFIILLFFIFLFIPRILRRPPLWVALMIVALALVPNSSIFIDERILGEGFKLYTKYIGGILSIWDIFILFGFLLVIMSKYRSINLSKSPQPNVVLRFIYIVWFVAAINGLVHSSILQYGFTSMRNVVQQVQPAVYFLLSLLLTRSMIIKEKDIDMMINTLLFCNLYLIVQGCILFILGITDAIPVMKGFGGIPIVMYDGLGFITMGVLIVIAKYAYKQQIKRSDVIVLIGGIFFVLVSTRRLNLLLLLVNSIVIWFAAGANVFSFNKIYRLVKYACIIVLPFILFMPFVVPEYKNAFFEVIGSINLSSEAGGVSGAFRLAQISNLFLNMNTEAPFSYIWGMGFGTQWFEFIPLIGLQPGGDTAYIAVLQDQGAQGWWPYFHLANISVIYRYGVVGAIIITCAGLLWFIRWVRANRTIHCKYQPIILVFVVTIMETIILLGDIQDSSWPAQLGIWLGVSEAIIKYRS